MRPRFLITISIFVLAVFAILYWCRPAKQQPIQAQQTNEQPVTASVPETAHPSVHPPTQSEIVAISNKAAENLKATLPEIIEAHNLPVEFWGEAVDQDDKPLSGVHIVMSIRQAGYLPAVGLETLYPKKEADSDSNGRFEWTGNKGDRLSIDTMEMSGYELEPSAQRIFGASSGSPENPVIFKMWGTNIHEKLITGETTFHVLPDGRSYIINLANGSIAESGEGDLRVWVKRPDPVALGQKYDWSCEMDAINGGLLQETNSNSSMYFAPTNNYEQLFQFEQIIDGGWGDSTGERRFYVALNNGQEYGRISIEIYAYYNNQIPALIRISYVINPSGSRILR